MRRVLSILPTLFLAVSGLAAEQPYAASLTMILEDVRYSVADDGSVTREETDSFRANNDQGVAAVGKLPLFYSATRQTLEILEAYTVTAAGKRIDVPADQITVKQSPRSGGAPMFTDYKVKTILFQEVRPGAVVTVHYRDTELKPLFPGNFSIEETWPASAMDVRKAVVTVSAPKSFNVAAEQSGGVEGGPVPSGRPGFSAWRYTVENRPAMAPELGGIGSAERGPLLRLSSFRDYAEVGRLYDERARPTAAVTPAIQAQADKLAQGLSDRRKQAEAIYDWVARNIRYVAVYLDDGVIVPHAADEILAAGYGDCKDHVTLLQALLAARGIDSTPVLVNAADRYALPRIVSPAIFDHAITYIPAFDLYVDSTVGIAPFGVLPPQELGKPALRTRAEDGKAKLVTLPDASARTDTVIVSTAMTIDADGTVKGTSTIRNGGIFDLLARGALASVQKGMEQQIGAQILKAGGQTGTGRYDAGDPRDLAVPFDLSSEFTLPGMVAMPGPGALEVPAGLGSLFGIAGAFAQAAPEKREMPVVLLDGRREEVTRLSFPAGVIILALPQPLAADAPFAHYESSYAQDGATVVVRRVLDIHHAGMLLPPESYPAFRELSLAVARDLKSQILYQ